MSMKRILFVTPYPFDKAPSQRLKFEQYYRYFEQNGYQIDKEAFISEEFWRIVYKKGFWLQKIFYTLRGYLSRIISLFTLRRYDVVYIHLWVTPFGFPFFEWLYCKLSKNVVYDIDDLVYLYNKNEYNSLVAGLKGRKKPIYLIKKANHVITCTPYLNDFVRKFNINSTDISSTIDTERYQPANNYNNEQTITIGWSGSHSTARHFLVLKDTLITLASLYKFKMLVIGAEHFSIPGVDLEVIPWSAETELKNLQRIDIGVYPLPNEQWVYGKSSLKALQYMALGIPTVATAIGTNFRVIDDGVNGFLIHSEQEWIDKLGMLIKDSRLRKEIGQKAREKVENFFSIEANKNNYLEILNNVVKSR